EPEYPPGFDLDEIAFAQQRLIAHCEDLRDRFAVLDPPFASNAEQVIEWRRGLGTSNFAALYYPWIIVDDPLGLPGAGRALPPSGCVAGVFARSDRLYGVHKPPANEVLESVFATTDLIDDQLHGQLNDELVNAIRMQPRRGAVLLGTRTLDPDFRWR